MTRYGKSQCVTWGLALLIDFGVPVKIAFLGPKQEQAGILRQYLAELIFSDLSLLKKAMISSKGDIRITKEASRKRMTFITGAEYRVFSGEGDANRLMGFGADIVVRDEACLINRDAYIKSGRMLGDNPDDGMQIELYNPWNKDNQAYEHSIDPEWHVIKIGWRQAVKEGRTTERFVMEQAKEYGGMSTLEFIVLYDSKFPDEAEDSLFNYQKLQEACKKNVKLWKDGRKIISCDVADKGLDWTVIMWGYEYEDCFMIVDIYYEPKSENMKIAGKIVEWYKEKGANLINIDTIGVGVGVVSRVKEVLENESVTVNACHFGEGVGSSGSKFLPQKNERIHDRQSESKKKRFSNRKAEQYFRLKELFDGGRIQIPEEKKLINELMKMRWELTSSAKIKVIDPENKSPDFADALCYFTWKTDDEVILDFGLR